MAAPLTPPSTLSALVEEGCVLTIGNFDGLHRGHQLLVDAAHAEANSRGLPVIALTFEPHPRTFFSDTAPETFRLTTSQERTALLLEAGATDVWACPFGTQLATMTPETFLRELLMGALRARSIHVGAEFRFGKGRAGDVPWLQVHGRPYGIITTGHPVVSHESGPVSSSRVRRALARGDLADVQALTGRTWAYRGRTVPGAGRGRAIGIPTLNLVPGAILLPPYGVYATACRIEAGGWRASITNIGVRPTFESDAAPTIETLILDQGDVPHGAGHDLEVRLLQHIRAETSFPTPEALTAQIEQDIRTAGEAHKEASWL